MPTTPPTDTHRLPDPWLFDSEALLRELDRCRETVLQIPITDPNATHFGIQLAVNAIYNLTENLRYLLHLHREQQRSIRRQHDQSLAESLSSTPSKRTVVQMNPTPSAHNGLAQQHRHTQSSKRRGRRRASSVAA
jgi:hypothetical protein